MSGHSFSQVPRADIPRSVFNRSHGYKTAFDAGYLIPFFVDEALPGDTFELDVSMFARLATPVAPVMDNMYLEAFFFAVPNRLLWDKWQRFMGEQPNPGDSIDFLVPQVTTAASGGVAFAVGDLFDYLGVPVGVQPLALSALPARAYNLIYNEWFRDQNMVDAAVKNVGDGPDTAADYPLRRRGKRHDYFTSCLPWPQKGVSVALPLGTSAPISGTAVANGTPTFDVVGATGSVNLPLISPAGAGNQNVYQTHATAPYEGGNLEWNDPKLNVTGLADLSAATASTINALRQAFQIQKLLERDARGGTRYIEILRSHFGVVSPDARLQRPEYLGGGRINVNVSPVPKTSSTDGTSPQGNLAAFGIASGGGIGFSKSFVEHCTLIGLVMARADLNYQQGLPRMFSRRTRYDFYWPAFAHLGEQAVLNKEIYCQGTADDELVFGYQERWAEYRYAPSVVTGKMRSNVAGSLDVWHLAQDFDALPALNAAFIEENPPVDRVIAVPAEPHFLFDSHFMVRCTRPMPMFSVPGLLDHF